MNTVDVTHHRLTANGLDQHYVTAGHGPPVILLHGFPTHQSMDAAALLKTVTKFTGEINDPDNVTEALANAFRAAAFRNRQRRQSNRSGLSVGSRHNGDG
jgi:pimeloyl-ACP methyl ester carboxylesterase